MLKSVMSRSSDKNNLPHITETLRRATLMCCGSEKFGGGGAKKLIDERARGRKF